MAGQTASGVDFALLMGGRISGTVTDAGSGQPLFDVMVNVYDGNGHSSYGYTGPDGSWVTFLGLPPGTYRVQTSNTAGYIDQSREGVPVSAGQTTSGIDFALSAGGGISGTVIDRTTRQPIPNVQVTVWSANVLTR